MQPTTLNIPADIKCETKNCKHVTEKCKCKTTSLMNNGENASTQRYSNPAGIPDMLILPWLYSMINGRIHDNQDDDNFK